MIVEFPHITEAYLDVSTNELIIYGEPLEEDTAHNCDIMKCPSDSHILMWCVIARGKIGFMGYVVDERGLDFDTQREI